MKCSTENKTDLYFCYCVYRSVCIVTLALVLQNNCTTRVDTESDKTQMGENRSEQKPQHYWRYIFWFAFTVHPIKRQCAEQKKNWQIRAVSVSSFHYNAPRVFQLTSPCLKIGSSFRVPLVREDIGCLRCTVYTVSLMLKCFV